MMLVWKENYQDRQWWKQNADMDGESYYHVDVEVMIKQKMMHGVENKGNKEHWIFLQFLLERYFFNHGRLEGIMFSSNLLKLKF